MLVKEKYKEYKDNYVRVHLSCGTGGYEGTFTSEELKKYYGDCECEDIYYEKDYGNGYPAIRHYLKIYSENNYTKNIEADRNVNRA